MTHSSVKFGGNKKNRICIRMVVAIKEKKDLKYFGTQAVYVHNRFPVRGALSSAKTRMAAMKQACLLYTSPSPRD